MNCGSYSNRSPTAISSSTPAVLDKIVCSGRMVMWSTPPDFYSEVHHRTRNSGLPSSLARSFAEPTALTVTEHLAMLPILLQIASNSDSSIGAWLGHFFDHQCTLIESLPFGTQSSSLWGVNSSESLTKWCKTGSRPAFLFGINHFTCLCSRSRRLQIIVGVLEYRCRSYAPH